MRDDRLPQLLETLRTVALSADLHPTLEHLLDSLQHLVPFDGASIILRHPGREATPTHVTRGSMGAIDASTFEGVGRDLLRIDQPRLARDGIPRTLRPCTRAQLAVPLTSPRGPVGVIVLESVRAEAFSEADLRLVALFAQQASVVIERAILHEQLVRQSRIDRDMEIARDIVHALAPEVAPVVAGLDVAGRSYTADFVGGDAFDFIPYEELQLGLSISDAKGKGIPGALLAVAHRAMLHALVGVDLRLRGAFGRMSDLLAQSSPPVNFVTSVYAIVDVAERQMVYVNAGHPPPLVVRATGTFEELAVTGPALGFPRVAPIREAYASFSQGDGLVLYTDGVTEAGPSPQEFLDRAGLRACIRRLWSRAARDICDGVIDEAMRRAGGVLADDATVVVVKFV
jgi:sigma-B regulation protein RsbU (phosphoserine phosphatase)